jgi:hypothetical protein
MSMTQRQRTLVWGAVCAAGAIGLGLNAFLRPHGFGTAYVRDTPVTRVEVRVDPPIGAEADEAAVTKWVAPNDAELSLPNVTRTSTPPVTWIEESQVAPVSAWSEGSSDPTIRFSLKHTLGIWVAAFFTLAVLSFLWRDNPVYRFTESVIVGVSAAYWMLNAFWATLVPNLVLPLAPKLTQAWAMPGTSGEAPAHWYLTLVPLALALMLLMRLSPKGGWIGSWPLAFAIGTTAGMRLVSHVQADFLSMLSASVLPLYVRDAGGGFSAGASIGNLVLVLGLLCVLTYFFFSVEHRGPVGKIARLGVWFLMVSFGAAFAFTVMGRITLLSERFEFLFGDWLWLIDPKHAHTVVDVLPAMR